jgi:hypothetical protein
MILISHNGAQRWMNFSSNRSLVCSRPPVSRVSMDTEPSDYASARPAATLFIYRCLLGSFPSGHFFPSVYGASPRFNDDPWGRFRSLWVWWCR